MGETLETRLIEQENWNSSFLIDLKQSANNKTFIEVTQVIRDTAERQTLKINPTILPHLIRTLSELQSMLPEKPPKRERFLSEGRQKAIEKKYLNGLPVKEIAWQENLPIPSIEQILYNFGHTELVKNGFVPPPKKFWSRKKRR